MFNSDIDRNPRVAGSKSPQYRQLMTELSIDRSTAMPIFAEATSQAVRLTNSPVAILTTISQSGSQISSISGLDRFAGLPTNANLHLELSGLGYCHTRTIGGEGAFVISNFQDCPPLSQSLLHCVHGIQSYLGLPIITAARDRLGTISILDFSPRKFSDREIDLLHLVSRLVASEFDRQFLSQAQLNRRVGDLDYPGIRGFDHMFAAIEHDRSRASQNTSIEDFVVASDAQSSSIRSKHNFPGNRASSGNTQATPDRGAVESHQLNYARVQGEIKFKLLTYLAQELRTPLTAVLGMASVLQQEIYGPLSRKQKDYLGIIYHSGQQLVTIVDEIAQLGGFVGEASLQEHRQQHKLTLRSVNPDMLCQLAVQSLEPIAQKKQQQIILNLAERDPLQTNHHHRIWLLDRDKVRQIIYYLSLSAIYATAPDHQIVIQLSDSMDGLQIQIVTSDPHVILEDLATILGVDDRAISTIARSIDQNSNYSIAANIGQDLRIKLGLSLSQTLAAAHGGKIELIANGLGYQLSLPLIVADAHSERLHQ
jgi:signal transduction histidine kinase